MRNKIWLSIGLMLLLLGLLTGSVAAQSTTPADDDTTPAIQIQPVTAVINQQVPVSLTFRIAVGPTDTQTVTIPVFLNLNIRLGLASPLSPTVGVTVNAVGAAPTISPTATTTTTTPAAGVANVVTGTPTTLPAPGVITGTPTVTVTATPTAPVVVAPTCPDPRSEIYSPGVNQVVSGTVTIRGSASHEKFQYYKLEFARGADASPAATDFNYFDGGNDEVPDGVLGTLDSTELPNGPYTIMLTVVDQTSNFPAPCPVTIVVQN
jgi:hypothetical protein